MKQGIRFLTLLMLLFTTLGFRTFNDKTWLISPSDTKVFVRFCSSYTVAVNDLPVGDPLYGASVSFASLVQSVYDDFNNVASTYFEIVDISDGDYNSSLHSRRIIDVCKASASGASSGEASLSENAGSISGCQISLVSSVFDGAKSFVKTFSHELGHCMGLDHPQESTQAIMSYFVDEDIVRLQMDDKVGLTHLYPLDASLAKEEATLGLSCTTN